MSEQIIGNPSFIFNVCFSDECTFFLNGFVNKHNCRYWDNENPHLFREEHTQFPQKINVWAGILGNEIIGPVFIEGNLNGELYLDMFENVIDPLITESLENLHFQQDGALPHYAVLVRN